MPAWEQEIYYEPLLDDPRNAMVLKLLRHANQLGLAGKKITEIRRFEDHKDGMGRYRIRFICEGDPA